jgi:5'-nucleotidase / UDP-sugar diphosphatase
MSRSFIIAVLGFMLSFSTEALPQQAQHLTILHLNDSHSNLVAGGPRQHPALMTVGGIARVATIIKRERLKDRPLLTLHAGDVFIGDPMYNLLYDQPAELSILAMLGLDAMAVGNHEFDLTPYVLEQALQNTLGPQPAFPLLSANLDLSHHTLQGLTQYISPATIKQYSGFRVGIFGLTTPTTNYFSQPSPAVVIENPAVLMPLIHAQVMSLRAQGCDIVILLSHMGLELEKLIVQNIPGIDVVVGGHSHIALRQPVIVHDPLNRPVSIVHTEGFNRQIGKLTLKIHKGVVTVQNYRLIDLDHSVPEDAATKAIVDGIATQLETFVPGLFTQPVALCTGTLVEKSQNLMQPGFHDTHVGNLVADAFMNATGADIGIQPGGSTAQPLYAGAILPVDIFRMIGYGFNTVNTLGFHVVTFDVTGAALMMGLEATLSDIESDDELLLQVSSSLSYSYDPSKPVGQRLRSVLFKGQPIDPTAVYSIATNEIVPMYLNLLGIPFSNRNVLISTTEFEVVTQHIINLGTLSPAPLPGRVRASIVPKTAVRTATATSASLSAAPIPFVETATITLAAEAPQEVSIIVVDLLGRTVATLHHGMHDGGTMTVTLHGNALPPGIYLALARLGNDGILTTRMVKTR